MNEAAAASGRIQSGARSRAGERPLHALHCRAHCWLRGERSVVVVLAAAWRLREADGSAPGATLALSRCGVAPSLVAARHGGEILSMRAKRLPWSTA